MRWFKRDWWKACITVAGMLLLLVLMVWVPVSAAGAYEGTPRLATLVTGTLQVTPTEDATVTALNKEKLTGEVDQQQHTWGNWLWSNAATILSTFLSTLVLVIGALFGFWRWRKDRRDAQEKELKDRQNEREKRAEERFQSVVAGLGSEREDAKAGAAIVLRSFLRPGYEQFYTQTFDLAVAHLRLRHLDPGIPEPLTSLSQALVLVFKEAFPLARQMVKQSPQFLDASCIRLDNAHLAEADLQQVWIPEASLRNAALRRADFSEASLYKVNLFQAELKEAILRKTNLYKANLVGADLSNAHLSQADLRGANLSEADLSGAHLIGVSLEDASSLEGTDLRGVTGLTKEQLEVCKAKGAIIDEDSTAIPSQPTVSPSLASQSTDVQAPPTPSSQESNPTPGTDGSNIVSFEREPKL
jgi:Pentapeptide repeats (8 copies)